MSDWFVQDNMGVCFEMPVGECVHYMEYGAYIYI